MLTLHMFDSGVNLVFTASDENGPMDLTGTADIMLYFKRPDKTIVSQSCTVINAPAGIVRYITQTNDFNQAGRWQLQLVILYSNGFVRHSSIVAISALANIGN